MLVIGGVLLVSLAGLGVLGVLCLGLWRRLVALLAEVAAVSERLAAVAESRRGDDLERDLAALREKHPGVDLEVRRPAGP